MDSEDEEEATAGGGMMGQLGAMAGGGGVPPLPGMPGVPALPGLPAMPGGLPGLPAVGGALPPPAPPGAGALPPLKDKAKDAPPPPAEEPEEEAGDNALVASFFVKESGAQAEILFVPDGIRLGGEKLKGFFEKQWKLAPPNTMLSCDAGTVHPKQFASIGLATLPSFEVFWADANQHAERAGRTEGQEVRACAYGTHRDPTQPVPP